ncbi:RNA-binding cell elongation regulator Jag/EloR [Sporolactobacillus putidus]|uniref:RNA-binding protein KhpB n=1 Tax=Sporolactobacillus putidus TaxID=492735 RepID=A0A917S4E8_9BACL|nr:RNA-binding cell elongation regulator Jag/EloR [Sporolactobacillus putidus]GGL57840.1 protein jag [Sporolactobacillus putidus]
MREVSKYGKTVELAISSALEELNATADQAEIIVVERPRSGFLGIGSKKALVRVTLKKTPFDSGIDFLKNLIEKMEISAHVQVSDKNGRICRCQFVGHDVSQLIGKHGQTLNALQYLANLVVNKNADHRMTLMLDVGNYRETRKLALISLADRVAEKVAKTKKTYRFDPMPSFERKIIHSELAGKSLIETFSFGEEPHRYVTVAPLNK